MDAKRARTRRSVTLLLSALTGLAGTSGHAQTPVTLFQSFVGNVNYQATGGSLRSQPNTADPCSLSPASTAGLAGVPGTATIRAAYLYWAGSGSTPDNSVTLNGTSISATRTFNATFTFNGTDYDFFSGFADVTALVSGNGNFTFSGLTANNGSPYCAVQAVAAGWSLVVVYQDAGEDLRAVNVFDGFQFFRGSALTLTVDTFRIPPAPVNGKVTHITWEGDPQNSGSLGGFSESLTFNSNLLDDGLIPPGSSPAVQQFDGTVNTLGVTTSYGVDVDTYDVSAFLAPGDTSATTNYSSGADLVLLSAEIISFTTEPLVDLSISKTHGGDFVANSTGEYLIRVGNNGPEDEANPVQVADTLPAGLSFVSANGSGWSCGAVGQDVTCTHPGPVPVGAVLGDLTLTVQVNASAAPSVANTATVTSASVDSDPTNDSSTDPTNVLASDLSTSTKGVVDLNGGDADPGDVLRYTITLRESAGIATSSASVTDDIPGLTTAFTVVSMPPGASDGSSGIGTGANGTGFLSVTDILVPAGGTASIVFEVTISASANPGDLVANLADVTNGNGVGAQPAAPNVIVSQSQTPGGGTKTLYLFDRASSDPNGYNSGPAPYLSRTPPATPQGNVTVDKSQPPVSWTMTPPTQSALNIDATSIPVTLYLSKGGAGGGPVNRTLTVSLSTIGALSGPLGAPVTQTLTVPPSGSPIAVVFNIPNTVGASLPSGTQIVFTVTNVTAGGGNHRVRVFPLVSGDHSRVDLPALTVIKVDTATSFSAPYPGGIPLNDFSPGAQLSLRADVSDPFGTFDIAPVSIDIVDPGGTPTLTGQPMTRVFDSGAASAGFEYLYTLPSSASPGNWTYRVTAVEGTEGIITDVRSAVFNVVVPNLLITKAVIAVSDPVNGAANPKAIPGAVMLYTVEVANQGSGPVDADSLVLTDILPGDGALYVDTAGGNPVNFVDGSPPSGLAFDYTTNVTFSNQPGGAPPFNYLPAPDADGFDPAITGLQVNPSGAFDASGAGGDPSFQIRFRIRVD